MNGQVLRQAPYVAHYIALLGLTIEVEKNRDRIYLPLVNKVSILFLALADTFYRLIKGWVRERED
jgi:hypothetical protein